MTRVTNYLTRRQQQILEFIEAFHAREGLTPTIWAVPCVPNGAEHWRHARSVGRGSSHKVPERLAVAGGFRIKTEILRDPVQVPRVRALRRERRLARGARAIVRRRWNLCRTSSERSGRQPRRRLRLPRP